MGLIIGLGILRTPGEIAATITDPWLYMGLWAGGGLMVLLSLLVVAELISMTPRSGGMYALIRHAYGPYPGFLIGWTDWLSNAASSALKTVVLMEYLALLEPSLAAYTTAGALLITTAFAALQLGGVRLGGGILQGGAAIIGLIMLCVAIALFYGGLSSGTAAAPPATSGVHAGLAGFGLVASAIVFTYDGWMGASYFGGEIKGGGRTAALGSIRGLLVVIALYLLLNFALVSSVPLTALQGNELALAGALQALFGAGAALPIILTAIFILLAHQNLQYMLGTRILYALSVDGLGTDRATSVSKLGTPTGALFFNWLLVSFLIVVGGFGFLLNMATMLWIVMYLAVIVGVFRLRRKEADAPRPYRAWGFPVTGYICTVFWACIVLFVAITDPRSTLYTLGLVAVSIPVYRWLKYVHRDRLAAA